MRAIAPGGVLVATSVGLAASVDPTAAALLLVVAVLFASLAGLASGLTASVLGALSLNYFFIEPERELVLFGKRDDAIALATFAVVAVVESWLVQRVRRADRSATAADARSSAARAEADASARRAALFASIGHDLRTPLAGIRAAADALVDEPPPDVRVQLCDALVSEARRVERVLDRVLQVGRLDSGPVALSREPVDVLGVVQACVRRAAPSVDVEVDVEEPAPPLEVDVVLFEQLVANLVDNAVTHGGGSRVRITGRSIDDDLGYQLCVADHGPGVPTEGVDALFGPAARTSTKGERGAGLGLAIVAAIAVAHGGTVHHESTPGGGATFCVEVPRR